MKFPAYALLAVILTAGPAFAQKVFIDYDKEYDKEIKTFAWSKTSETSLEESQPFLHSAIVNGIEYYMTQGGNAREVDSDPDVYLTYHTSSKEKVVFNTTNYGYGYPGGWATGGYHGVYGGYGGYGGMSTTTASTYQMGTLIVDVWDAHSNQLIWRGSAANITVTDNPDKMKKRLDKALKKMVGEWQKIEKRNAKMEAKEIFERVAAKRKAKGLPKSILEPLSEDLQRWDEENVPQYFL